MADLAFELVAFVPWTEGGLEDYVFSTSVMAPGGLPDMLWRDIPELLRADGTLWLASRRLRRVVRFTEPGEGELFPLDAAQMDGFGALVATADGGLALFGVNGEEVALARLSGAGELLWRTTALSPIQRAFELSRLLVDLDGSVYLYTAERPAGQGQWEVARVSLDDGAVSDAVVFEERTPREMWVQDEVLYWVAYEKIVYSWERHEIATGERNLIAIDAAQATELDRAVAFLPGGGMLLYSSTQGALIWTGPDGKETGRLTLAGIVRAGDGVAAGVWEGDTLTLARWSDGKRFGVVEIDVSFGGGLIYADEDEYYLMSGQSRREATIRAIDVRGEMREVAANWLEVNEFRLQHEGIVGGPVSIVTENGTLLRAGADGEGAFIVRITGAP